MERDKDKGKDPSESEWDDMFTAKTLEYEGPVTKVKNIATHLRQAFPDDEIEIELQFETYSLLQKFEKTLQLEYEIYRPEQKIVEKNDWDTIWKEIHMGSMAKKVPGMTNMKVYKIMFGNPLQCSIFYSHYEKKIKRFQTEYNYIIIPYRKKIGVYLKNPNERKINSFFVTELVEMKNKLLFRVQGNQEIYKKARYSKNALEMLEKVKIKTMIISRYQCVVFYSENYQFSWEISKQISRILAYHVSVIKFPERYVNKYILKEIMRLIYFEIKPALKEIQRYYDMPVEVDIQKAAIVITDFHEIFSDGVNLVRENLGKLKILEIQCDSLVDLKQIMQKAQYLPLVKFNYRYRRCFLLFSDLVTEKQNKIMVKFCDQIATVFKGKYIIVVHFTHLFQDQEKLREETERVRAIAAEHKLNNITYSSFSLFNHFDKVVFQPVELSVYVQDTRQQQIKMFLVDYVTNKKIQTQKFIFSIFEIFQLDESLLKEYNEEKSIISYSASVASSQNKESRANLEDINRQNLEERNRIQTSHLRQSRVSTFDTESINKSDFLQLSIPFEYPKSQNFEENVSIKPGKREWNLQKLMEKEFKRKLRVWKVIIHFSIGLPSMKSYEKIEIMEPDLFEIKNSFFRLKRYKKVTSKKVNEFKGGQIGYISFVKSEKDIFIPIYKVQFVDE